VRSSRHLLVGLSVLASAGLLADVSRPTRRAAYMDDPRLPDPPRRRRSVTTGFYSPEPLNKSREQTRRLKQMERKAVKDARKRGFYVCGEGYAHKVGTVCTGQCVLRG
jgi:hypothetical protein